MASDLEMKISNINAISETDYKVRLDLFEGPLDLLLHLIKKNELDIYDIPISTITRQYLEYITLMKELNLEIAGEFLVMASTLLQIKSDMLLPSFSEEVSSDLDEDPRAELIRRLLEYMKFKDAAIMLDNRDLAGRDLFTCKLVEPQPEISSSEDECLEMELFDLIAAFQGVLKKHPVDTFHEVTAEAVSISERITEILTILQGRNFLRFDELFRDSFSRENLIASFLAILELCKLKMVRILQTGQFAEIFITPAVADTDGAFLSEVSTLYV